MKRNCYGVAFAVILLLLVPVWFRCRFVTSSEEAHTITVDPKQHVVISPPVQSAFTGCVSRIIAAETRKKVKDPDLPPAALARWRELEALGHLPANADIRDLRLAAMTSWWGQSLDPKRFWDGRPVWLDQVSVSQAGMFGRSFPPIPPGDHRLPVYHERKKNTEERLAESMAQTIPPSECTSEERCFWGQWRKTHPNPPETIGDAQYKVARDMLGFQGEADASIRDTLVRRAVDAGLPLEAFDTDALRWALIEGTRRQQLKDEQDGRTRSGVLSGTLDGCLLVDGQYALRDLTPEEQKAADAWKIRYLRRLRAEKTDEMYIQAYLKAWNLDPKSVFGP